MIAAIVSTDPAFRADGKTDDYVAGRFDTVLESTKKAGRSLATINAASATPRADALENPLAKVMAAAAAETAGRFAKSYAPKEG